MPLRPSRRSILAAACLPFATRVWSQQHPEASRVGDRRRVGDFTVVPLRDGLFPLEPAMIPGARSEEGRALLVAAGLPPDGPSPEPVNAFLIRRGARTWLLDAGCGGVFGPDFGKVSAALRAEGVDPAAIEAIWLTHLHADHAGGLLAPGGGALFPNAEIVVQAAEVAYWSDAGSRSRAPAEMGTFFDTAQAVLAAYRGRIRTVSGAAEPAPGVSFLPLPGHTPGHAGVHLSDGGERLLIWGDVVHSRILQMPHPDWTVIWDMDRAQAHATRLRAFDMAVAEGLTVAGMHLATAGRIERRGAGYAFV